jgi:hypothetical protein
MDLDNLWDGFMFATDIRAQGVIDFLDKQFGQSLSISFMANQVPQRESRIELHPTVTDKMSNEGRPHIENQRLREFAEFLRIRNSLKLVRNPSRTMRPCLKRTSLTP